ncbi:hypothetical protein CKAH01_00427 [Colletotrichum kahawae]|uniref:Uncharacterized protein n=1 Tax=Colletotrichum kahawae TaxID=34407 RepID=A0AAD9YXK5_COLKA|nr:hypothetical protein CKAH01_00427 [Colletotrichum kahawae]
MLHHGRPRRLSSARCLKHLVMVYRHLLFFSGLIRGNHGIRLSRRCDQPLGRGSARLDTRRRYQTGDCVVPSKFMANSGFLNVVWDFSTLRASR